MHTLNLLSCSILNINFMISVSIPFEIVSSLSTLHFIIFIFYLTNTVIALNWNLQITRYIIIGTHAHCLSYKLSKRKIE